MSYLDPPDSGFTFSSFKIHFNYILSLRPIHDVPSSNNVHFLCFCPTEESVQVRGPASHFVKSCFVTLRRSSFGQPPTQENQALSAVCDYVYSIFSPIFFKSGGRFSGSLILGVRLHVMIEIRLIVQSP
jgi:hypothetical protein